MLAELAIELTFVSYINGKEFTDVTLMTDSADKFPSAIGVTLQIVQKVISSYIEDGLVSSHAGCYKKCE